MRFAVLAVVTMTGCALDGGSDVDAQLGAILFYGDGPEVQVPGSARVGEPIHIVVETAGGGCVHYVRTDVEQTADRVVIYPYDSRPPTGAICTQELRSLEHLAVVRFSTAGTKTIEVFGRSVDSQGDEVISVPLSIDVTP
ncbi:MAG: hypothetical protein ACKV2T_34005 [Kofleriaceae bacterium]